MNHRTPTPFRQATWRNLLGITLGATYIATFYGCANSASSRITVLPLTSQSYRSISSDAMPKRAYLKQIASERNQTPEQAALVDETLSLDENPFSYKDDRAVQNGGVIYAAHCASCHGIDASGSGAAMPAGSPKMSFHNSHKKMYIQLTGHAPRNWAPAVSNGQTSSKTAPDGRPLAMPPFKDTLAREQIWLAVTYLEYVTLHPDEAPKTP